MQIKGIRVKLTQAMKKKRNMGTRLRQLRKSKLRIKDSKGKKRYLDRIKTIVIQVAQLTKRSQALRQQLKKLTLNSKGKPNGSNKKVSIKQRT